MARIVRSIVESHAGTVTPKCCGRRARFTLFSSKR